MDSRLQESSWWPFQTPLCSSGRCHDSWHQIRWPVTGLFSVCLCLFTCVWSHVLFWGLYIVSHTEGTYFPQPEYQLQLPRRFFQMPWPSDWGASTESKSGQLRIHFCALGAQLLQKGIPSRMLISKPFSIRVMSGCIQDQEHTRHLGACGAPMDLQVATQGEHVPAECLSWSVTLYKSKYVHEGCQGTSKTRSVLDVWVPVELQQIYEGSLKGNVSLLNAWVEML